jgi:hypothetical protein
VRPGLFSPDVPRSAQAEQFVRFALEMLQVIEEMGVPHATFGELEYHTKRV